jgi:GTP-binding protein YchF
MGLKCGIVGLTNSGKTTLFNCISNTKAEATNFAFSTNKSNLGVCYIPDTRLMEIDRIKKAERIIFTDMEVVDIPGLAKGSSQGEGIGNSFLADIRQVDAIIHVVRCFDDPNMPHMEGSVDPIRDIETLDLELQVTDLEQIERKIARTEKIAKSGDKDARKILETLHKAKEHLENFENIRSLDLSSDEQKHIADLMLLTQKPVMFVCNVDDNSAKSGNDYSKAVVENLKETEIPVVVVAGKIESEIAELEDEEERMMFLEDLGLTEPSVNILVRKAYELLNLISFFTVGEKENRAWTIKRGMTAPNAAGAIHSDLERGFIRAEVIKYYDLIELGTEAKCKEAGKMSVEGKNYIVEDGDVLHIRFNV